MTRKDWTAQMCRDWLDKHNVSYYVRPIDEVESCQVAPIWCSDISSSFGEQGKKAANWVWRSLVAAIAVHDKIPFPWTYEGDERTKPLKEMGEDELWALAAELHIIIGVEWAPDHPEYPWSLTGKHIFLYEKGGWDTRAAALRTGIIRWGHTCNRYHNGCIILDPTKES